MSEIKTRSVKNAMIKSATLSNSDHGCLSGWLHVEYGGADGGGMQGFGGFALYPAAQNFTGLWVQRCLDIAGVTDWSALPGRCIRVRTEPHWNGRILAIGHILEDDWFDPKMESEAMRLGAEELEREAFNKLSPAERIAQLRKSEKMSPVERAVYNTMYPE